MCKFQDLPRNTRNISQRVQTETYSLKEALQNMYLQQTQNVNVEPLFLYGTINNAIGEYCSVMSVSSRYLIGQTFGLIRKLNSLD